MDKGMDVAERLADVRRRIAEAARRAGRDAAQVTLIAVTKTYDAEAILPAIAAGQRQFGENRVQEAKAKWPPLREAHPGLELHLIGPLQSKKTRDAVAVFDVIHTVDRPKIVDALVEEMREQQRRPKLFIQVNTGREPQKAGVSPEEAPALLALCLERDMQIEGLMCIPPIDQPPEGHFELLAKLAGQLGLAALSMGMSADYETAIQCGATHVRVGSALLGARG